MTLKTDTRSPTAARSLSPAGRRIIAIALGAAVVAIAAQVSVPLPFSPVPMTLSPLAVLLVGGLLGAREGAAAVVAYVLAGAAGLPVYAGGAAGAAALIGATGGYLLAFPVAAGVVGWVAKDRGWAGAFLGALAGIVIIHAGGLAQLTLLTGDLSTSLRLGTLPFLPGDVVKLAVATIGIATLGPSIRSRV